MTDAATTTDPRAMREAVLRAAHARGDLHRAMEIAFTLYGPELLGFLAAVLRNEDEARELFAQVSLEIVSGLPAFEWRSSFRTWAYRIARHALDRHVRHPSRRRAEPLTTGRLEQLAAPAPRTGTRPYLRSENQRRLERLREALHPDDRALLVLRIDRGLAWEEIADVLARATLDDAARARASARLRKRFDRLKQRIREHAVREGWLDR